MNLSACRSTAFLLVLLAQRGAVAQPTLPERTALLASVNACPWSNSLVTLPAGPYLVLDVIGSPLARSAGTMAEDEDLTVYVIGDADLLSRMSIQRTSATRDPDRRWIIGANATAALAPRCDVHTSVVGDFAPSVGEVTLRFLSDSGQIDLGKATFPVRRVYRGTISFGPLVSTLPARTFSVVPAPGATAGVDADSVLVGAGGTLDTHYAFLFTYYLNARPGGTGRVDDGSFAVGPFVAVPISGNPLDNAFVGLSADVGGFVLLHLGARFGKVTRLVSDQGLREGDAVEIRADAVATEQVWKPSVAFGISVDAATAASAFGRVISQLVAK